MLTLNYGSIIKALLLRLCYYGSIKALSSRLYEGSIKAPLGSIKALAPLGLYAGTIKALAQAQLKPYDDLAKASCALLH